MMVARRVADLRRGLRSIGRTSRLGFVPTMGAFHEGHVALMRAARSETDLVVVSAFINPTQFDDAADLAAYPRDVARDTTIARQAGIDVFFVPDVEDIYPPGDATTLEVSGAATGLEGAARPGHFNGVALVCLKLFCLVDPAVVYLGQKDAQQVAVLRQLVRDVNLRVDIRVVPTIRENDGLALSSRNSRLSPADRRRVRAIPEALRAAVTAHRAGSDPVVAARQVLTGVDIDYVAIAPFASEPTLVVAVHAGGTRLIDNVPLDHPELAGL
jgi:pantoate--beta-alanine ligase